jgi:multidrug efflux system outer membrane protein
MMDRIMEKKSSRLLQAIAVSAVVFLIAGCTVGPEYEKPNVTTPAKFHGQKGSEAASVADLPWWNVFEDKKLQGLIIKALNNNHDLQVAVARVEQARAAVGVVKSGAAPQVGYQGFAGGAKTFTPQDGGGNTIDYGTVGGALNASWELDIWGRIHHATEAAQANLLAQEDVRRGVILTLVSEVAVNYFNLLSLDRELAIAEESSRVYRRTQNLFADRFSAGKDSELPVQRAGAAYHSSTATIANLKSQIAQREYAIRVLIGTYPGSIERGRSLTVQKMPKTPLGTTTTMMQRRPDILQAEQVMVAANAEIGVAVANFYPRVDLAVLLGLQAANVTGSFEGFSIGQIFGSVAGPLFTGDRLESIYKQRQAFWDEAVARYKKTVVTAFRETSDALVAQKNLVGQRQSLKNQVQALRRSMELALMRYDGGRASYFEVLEAQQQLFPAEAALAQTQRDQLIAVVSLYKALGGGWKSTAKAEAPIAKPYAPSQKMAQAKGE